MSQMKELYEKVAKDGALQEKLNVILKEAEEAGQEETNTKLVAFAKDAGFDPSIQEMQEFFAGLAAKRDGELSNLELDMVAGGKSEGGTLNVLVSVFSFGIGCAITSIINAVEYNDCAGTFK